MKFFLLIFMMFMSIVLTQSCVTTANSLSYSDSEKSDKGFKKKGHYYTNYDRRVTDHFLKALNHKELGNIYGAIVEFQNAFKINKDGYIQKEIADCYIILKQYDNALVAIDITIEKLGSEEPDYLLLKLKILNNIEDWSPESAAVIEKLIEITVNDKAKKFSYYSLLMELHYRTKNFDKMFETVDRALFDESFNNEQKKDLILRKAAFSIVSRNYPLAKESYSYYLDNIDGRDLEILKRLNEIYLIEKDYHSFLEKQEIVLSVDSMNTFNYNQYFFVLEEIGEKEKSVNFLKKSLEKFPKDYTLNFSLAKYYITENDTSKARETFFSILKNDSTDIAIYNELAMMYDFVGNKEEAVKMYEVAFDLKQDDVTILNNYAYILSEMNIDLERALEMSKKTLSLTKNVSSYLDTYAWILFRLQRYADAESYLKEAILYNTDKRQLYILHEHLAGVLIKLDREAEAEEELKKSLKAKEMYNN